MKQGKMKDKNNKNQSKKGFYKHQELNRKRAKRILELEKRNHIKMRNKRLEYLQVEGLENCMFISQILGGIRTGVTIKNGKTTFSLTEVNAEDQFTAIVKVQGVNRVFNEQDKLELWLLRRYQITTQKQNLKRFEKQRRWLKNMLDAYYIAKKPQNVKKRLNS